jgi:uncharacterized protein YbaP (TraB family)
MNRYNSLFILLIALATGCKQKDAAPATAKGNSLLWKVSGNGLKEPSYIYGTVHVICSDDALLSDEFKKIIRNTDEIYFEIDMDDMDEMMSSLKLLKMKGDTTLELLLSASDLEKVKNYIKENSTMLPFSQINTWQPILVSSLLVEQAMDCPEKTGIEKEIMAAAKKDKKNIGGMETMQYQLSLTDSIPYVEQVKELVSFIDSASNKEWMKTEMEKLYGAYNEQDLEKMLTLTNEMDSTIIKYADMLLVNRNKNWVAKLKQLMPEKSLVLAVGAGHLPGEKGLISLLRKEGYEVTPIENNISRKKK